MHWNKRRGFPAAKRFGMEEMNRYLVECVVVAEKVEGHWESARDCQLNKHRPLYTETEGKSEIKKS